MFVKVLRESQSLVPVILRNLPLISVGMTFIQAYWHCSYFLESDTRNGHAFKNELKISFKKSSVYQFIFVQINNPQ